MMKAGKQGATAPVAAHGSGLAKWRTSSRIAASAGTHAHEQEVKPADDALDEAHRVLGQSHHSFKAKETPTGKVEKCLASTRFESILSLVICLNICLIIVETDIAAQEDSLPTWITVANVSFLVVYSIECVLKISVFGLKYFQDAWNWLDLLVVFSDVVLTLLNFFDGLERVSVLRIFRLIKLARSVRVVRHIWELKILLLGFQAAAKSIFFGMGMVIVMTIVWAILGVQLIHPVNTRIWENEDCELCKKAFSSVWYAGVYIFQTVVAGDSWGTLAIPIIDSAPWTSIWFLVVLVTVQLAMLNLILAVIVERAADAREQEVQRAFIEQEDSMQKSKLKLIQICRQLDTDGSGHITEDEFLDGFENNPAFAAAVLGMGVYPEDIGLLFEVVDTRGTGEVTYVNFVNTLARLRTQMNQVILFSVTELRKAVSALQEDLKDLKGQRSCGVGSSDTSQPLTGLAKTLEVSLDKQVAHQVDEMSNELHSRLQTLQQEISISFHHAVRTLMEARDGGPGDHGGDDGRAATLHKAADPGRASLDIPLDLDELIVCRAGESHQPKPPDGAERPAGGASSQKAFMAPLDEVGRMDGGPDVLPERSERAESDAQGGRFSTHGVRLVS